MLQGLLGLTLIGRVPTLARRMLGIPHLVELIDRAASFTFDFTQPLFASLLSLKDLLVALVVDCFVLGGHFLVDTGDFRFGVHLVVKQTFQLDPRLLDEPDRLMPGLGEAGSEHRPSVRQEIHRMSPRGLQAGPGVGGDLRRAVDRLGPGGLKEFFHRGPDLVERRHALLPLELEREPQNLGGQADVARRQGVADALPSGQRVVLQTNESFGQPTQRLGSQARGIQEISSQRRDRSRHDDHRRKQCPDHGSQHAQHGADAGDDSSEHAEHRADAGDHRAQHNNSRPASHGGGPQLEHGDHQLLVLPHPIDHHLDDLRGPHDQVLQQRSQRRADGERAALHDLPQIGQPVAKHLGRLGVLGADRQTQVASLLFEFLDALRAVLHQRQQVGAGAAEDLHGQRRAEGGIANLRQPIRQQCELFVGCEACQIGQPQAELAEREAGRLRALGRIDQELLHLTDTVFQRGQVGARLLGGVAQLG